MQKVVAINLNGRAYHVEEPGYDALVAYLDRAGTTLADNPDRAEILRDLEQAIADKCDRLLGPHKTVVEAAEVDRILAEMGPVDAGDGSAAADGGTAAGAEGAKAAGTSKRLYQIREGAMVSGVCAGIAAYLDVDQLVHAFNPKAEKMPGKLSGSINALAGTRRALDPRVRGGHGHHRQ